MIRMTCSCGRGSVLEKYDACFDCANADNPFLGVSCSIEVGAEDSRDQRRIADGSAGFNAGLPGVETVVGTRPDGKPRLEYRPVTNAEVGTGRSLREYAKRCGLEPVSKGRVKRAVGR
jgi:hypothetical protein